MDSRARFVVVEIFVFTTLPFSMKCKRAYTDKPIVD